ncbi:uncharacterized protein LOC118745545 [Rhagoletis pomonella]|uniref:uncharacterized protein LOC118745545 n=1 Tax=Rhagoletis pomonella TaxID=28610 RepID=UPI0017806DCD|nr:uncharacterized protein LOC118745545 [Rhagoletis pomonella]
MVECMTERPDITRFAKGAKEDVVEFWEGVAQQLNSLGPSKKDVSSWKKVWLDYKCYIKRKRSANKAETRATGGGPNRMHNFNELEEKVIELTGLHTSTSGINGAVSFGVVTTQTVTQPVVEPAAVVPMPTEPDNANVQRHSPPLKKRQGHFGTGANKFATKLLPKKFGLFRADNVRLTYQVQENMYDMKKEKLRKLKRHNIEMEALKRRELDLQEKLLRIQERSQHK